MARTVRSVDVATSDYEGMWAKATQLFRDYRARGGNDAAGAAADIHRRVVTGFADRPRFRFHFAQAGLKPNENGDFTQRVIVRDGKYEVVPAETEVEGSIPYLLKTIRDMKPDTIVELGSGYGRVLFQLAAAIGKDLPPLAIKYHACEITEGGRALTAEIHKLAPGMDLAIHRFDYYQPDLSFLPKDARVLFYSVASVEQIPELPLVLAEALTSFRPGTVGVHFEPIGWQSDSALVAARYAAEGTVASRLRQATYQLVKGVRGALNLPVGFSGISLAPSDIGSSANVKRNAAAWSLRKSYNRNMIRLFSTPPVSDRIVMKNLHINAFGDVPFNPETILHWQAK